MPVYVYRTESGDEFEVEQSIHDDALQEVDGKAVKRIPQVAIATYKGNGWARK